MKTHFKLLRYFSATSLISVVIVASLLGLFYRQLALNDLIELAESKNISLTQTFANFLWPQFAPFVTSVSGLSGDELRARPETAKLRQAVLAMMEGLSVVKIKVYNLQGLTVFSTQLSQIGEDKSNNAGFLSARSGKVASELTHRDTFSAFEQTIEDRDIFSSYIPIRRGPGGPIEGVFELYYDVTPFLQKMGHTQRVVVIGVVLIFVFLYGLLFIIVRRADKIIKRQEVEGQQYLEEIKKANETLEQRVQTRTQELSKANEKLETEVSERKRAQEETQFHLQRITALREIDMAITSSLDLRAVLDVLFEKTDRLVPFIGATTVRLVNRETGDLEPVACRNLNEEEWKAETKAAASEGLAGMLPENSAPLMVLHAQTDRRSLASEFLRKNGLVSYLRVPLMAKGKVLGVITFFTKEEHDFSTEEVDFLSTLAGQAAIAIHNSQLYENARLREKQLEETNRMLSALHAVAATTSQSLDLDHVLQSAIGKITEIFGFDATQIHIYNERTDELFWRAGFEREPNRFVPVQSFKRGQGIVGEVAQYGKSLIFEDVQTDPLYRKLSRSRISGQGGYHLFAIFPIKGQRAILGTVACTGIDPRKLTLGEIQFLEAIADQIAVAIENGELYEQLRQKIEELQQANKVKDEFLSVMSHELRTPLNVVMGYTAMIKDEMLGSVNTGQRRALEKVITRSNDLLNMITSILYATSIEAKEVRVQNTRFALPDLLDEIKRFYESSLSKPITLNWDYPSGLPVVTLDRDKVRVVLQKIIDNATKFTERGRVAISARVKEGGRQEPTGKRQDGEESLSPRAFLEVKVKDTGVGITKEKLPIIFEKFRQADSSETRRFGGVGLGLYIAKHFTELMGGKIEVETEEGKGSIFTVRVPCAISTPAAANRESERQEAAGAVQQIY